MLDIVDFGNRLKELRKGKGLTQSQLATRLSLTKSVISAYESSLRYPSYDVLLALSRTFGVSTDFLLGKQTRHTVDISDLSLEHRALVFELVTALKSK